MLSIFLHGSDVSPAEFKRRLHSAIVLLENDAYSVMGQIPYPKKPERGHDATTFGSNLDVKSNHNWSDLNLPKISFTKFYILYFPRALLFYYFRRSEYCAVSVVTHD